MSSWYVKHNFLKNFATVTKLFKPNILSYINNCYSSRYRQFSYNNYYLKNFNINCINLHVHLKNHTRNFFTSVNARSDKTDIPDYLKEIANEISDAQENFVEDLEELVNYMEEDIIDYFLSRAISFEELESNFIVSCPSCGDQEKSHDMFIDKNSGYCVCPWCCIDGKWEDIMKLFDSHDHYLSKHEFDEFFCELESIDESHSDFLQASSFQIADIPQLKSVNAKISDDKKKIIFPLQGLDNETTGFVSFSLLHKHPKAILRVLEGKTGFFLSLPLPKSRKARRLVIVSNISDALKLAKYKIHALVLYSDPKLEIMDELFRNFKSIVLWCSYLDIHNDLLNYLSSRKIETFVVKYASNLGTISELSEHKISQLLMDLLPVTFSSVINILDISDRIYDRLINKDQVFGVKWKRFTELNDLLLGHRNGELTVFSGQTGSGKTTLMSEYSLDLCMQGVRTLWGSFEISKERLYEVMLQQYSGKSLPYNYSKYKEIVDEFSLLPMFLLDFHGQQPIKDVINMMTEAVLLKGVTHIIIDNLQFMLGLHGASGDWWLEQDRAVSTFRQFATTFNCHITLIVHPKKLQTGEKLNLQSISGGARVTQEADNVMILHVKENRDGSSNILGSKTLQIVKNRYGGTLGEMRLRFHKESLTLSSCFRSTNKEGSSKEIGNREDGHSTKTSDFKNIASFMKEED
ncbi:Twinkle protein, mitochondrial [Armadillidium nasatum]|uniref:Twinkle protein, mitochondrial n=1 Tax=Armadillidium nasatum TaxID=96803 RepID=A0A5N5SKQ7_9CRUS|nr:Twinkle protein, mitochondrial [Armadillidium nasatum]